MMQEGGPLRRSNYRHQVWLSALEKAGLEELRFHDLRHTAVALWIHAGANPLEVKRRAGHERSASTQHRYGPPVPECRRGLGGTLGRARRNAATHGESCVQETAT
jgi:integrase